jgi:ATP-dependent RNA helicase DeaD
MGFIDDIKDIIKKLPTTHQTAMFSATMPKPILDLTKNFMNDPKFVKVESTNDEIKEIKQYYTMVGRNEKYNALIELYKTFNPKLSLIFCNTKRQVDVIHAKMTQDGFYVLSIHGDMTQYERKQTMKKVKNNECNILIGTDILARGIDINDVDYVFNYDLPIEDEYYVHRIGRTGRAGKSGTAVSIITTKNQITQMNNLAKLTHGTVDEYKLVPSKITLTEYLAKNSALNNAEVKEQTSSDDTQNTQVENTTADANTDTKLDVEKTKKDFYRKDKKFKDEDKRFMEKDENTTKNDVSADFNDKKSTF